MRSAFTAPVPTYPEAAPCPETEVRSRVLVWCAAWGSVNGAFPTDTLRDIVAAGPIRMAADFGRDVAVSMSFEDYAAFWSPLLRDTYSDWSLVPDAPVDVRVQSGMAAATFSSRFMGATHDGRRLEQRQRVLQVWERIHRAWRLTHEQTTVDTEGACI